MPSVITNHLGYLKLVELIHDIDTVLDSSDKLERLIKQELNIPAYLGPLDEVQLTIKQNDIVSLVHKLLGEYRQAAAQYELLIDEATDD